MTFTKRSSLLVVLFALGCGPRGERMLSPSPPAGTAAAPERAAEEPITGDPAMKTGATALGKAPPELDADAWLGSDRPIALRDLVGRPVLVQFSRLHDVESARARAVLAELRTRYARWGLTIVEVFVDRPSESASWNDWHLVEKEIAGLHLAWPAGFGDRVAYTELRYAIARVPSAYLIDADGKLVWSGDPAVHPSLRHAVETIAARVP